MVAGQTIQQYFINRAAESFKQQENLHDDGQDEIDGLCEANERLNEKAKEKEQNSVKGFAWDASHNSLLNPHTLLAQSAQQNKILDHYCTQDILYQ